MLRYTTIILFLMASLISSGQFIATFEVNLPHLANGLEVPVSTSLKDIKSLPAADSMMLMDLPILHQQRIRIGYWNREKHIH
jgi:hypothetical protein